MKSILILAMMMGSTAFAKMDGSNLPECKGVTDVCTTAGFEPGEHKKNGKGLWADCVAPLAKGKQVAGVTGVTQDAAKACAKAAKAARRK